MGANDKLFYINELLHFQSVRILDIGLPMQTCGVRVLSEVLRASKSLIPGWEMG